MPEIGFAAPLRGRSLLERGCDVIAGCLVAHSLLLNLGRHDDIPVNEQEQLLGIFSRERVYDAGHDLVRSGDRPAFSQLLSDGFAARYKIVSGGGRQITAIHVPGDFVDLHGFLLKKMDHGIVALSHCRVSLADHAELRTLTEKSAHLTRLLWLETLIDGAIHREWLVAMGRKSKQAHLAHLICELFLRLKAVERTSGRSFHLPLIQEEVADVLGLSSVHLNRVLQTLRKSGAVSWRNQTVTIEDWDRLAEMAEFDPTYLNLRHEPR